MKICECGNKIKSKTSELCLRCANVKRATKHGYSKSKLYPVWSAIKQRCNNPKCDNYKNYGARGITVCEEWRNDFKAFYDWAMENGYKEGLSIDRRENDGNYEPDNCRFTDFNTQIQNQRVSSRNSSGYRGVFFDKSRNKYVARLSVNGKNNYLGRFKTAKEAGIAYNNFIIANKLNHKLNEV